MTIRIFPSPTADTRSCDYKNVSKEQLRVSGIQHIEDVSRALEFFVRKLRQAAACHDADKLTDLDAFYKDFLTGFESHEWWDRHRALNRHHLLMEDGIPEDVNLIDVLDMIADCVMAGMARTGTVYPLEIDPALLKHAFDNTAAMLQAEIEVVAAEPQREGPSDTAQVQKEKRALESEAERLQESFAMAIASLEQEVESNNALRAREQRLREALEQVSIWAASPEHQQVPLLTVMAWISQVCRTALAVEPAREGPSRPKIVCLCGSTRFTDIMLVKQWELTKAGCIVVSWCAVPDWYHNGPHVGDAEGVKEIVDEVHMRKIDLCGEVFVINVDGYIGESTRNEIAYAEKTGKPVRYLEPIRAAMEESDAD